MHTLYDIRPVSNRGFTLLEMILFTAISVLILTAVATLYGAILTNDAGNNARARVDDSVAHALRLMTDAIRHAEAVVEPAEQSGGGEMILTMEDAGLDPTTFTLVDGVITMQEGENESMSITPEDIRVSSLWFESLSENSLSDSVRIRIDAEYISESARVETQFANTYYAGATTR